MKHPVYVAFGIAVLMAIVAVELRGWTPADASEVKDIPRSVRDNPGSYRPHYTHIGSSYRRGK